MNLFEVMAGRTARMSSVTRYSGYATIRRENVAEHSWWVAFISMVIADDITEQFKVIPDMHALLSRALCHDLSEIVSGDIIRPYKYANSEMLRITKVADLNGMEETFGGTEEYALDMVFFSWLNAKDNTLEGDIIKFADMLAVVFYCFGEAQLGNEQLVHTVVKELYETWLHDFHFHRILGQYLDQIFPNKQYTDLLLPLSLRERMKPVEPKPLWGHGEGAVSKHDWSKETLNADTV